MRRNRNDIQRFATFKLQRLDKSIAFLPENFEKFFQNVKVECGSQQASPFVPLLAATRQQASLEEWMEQVVNYALVDVLRSSQNSFSVSRSDDLVADYNPKEIMTKRLFELSSCIARKVENFICEIFFI